MMRQTSPAHVQGLHSWLKVEAATVESLIAGTIAGLKRKHSIH
jgi:hypothetical protein